MARQGSGGEGSQAKRSGNGAGRVVVVDDEEMVARTLARALDREGLTVDVATNAADALAILEKAEVDAIVSDIGMPEMDGIALLRAVRARDLYLPVILVTGGPSVESAARAVEHGAFRYLAKPVDPAELCAVVRKAIRTHRLAHLRDQAAGSQAAVEQASDRIGLDAAFDRALDALWVAHQPIVRWSDRSVFGYEALVRSAEPALPHPGALFDAAERLDRLPDLGRAIWARAARDAEGLPEGILQFVNLHPRDLEDEVLFDARAPLSGVAARVVLEITERASLDKVADLTGRLGRLRDLGFRFAVDDLGAGYAGLSAFTLLDPELVKLDMSLVRGVHESPKKVAVIHSMTELCRDLGVLVVTEGVETAEERDALIRAGCDLLQGYLFAKPAKPYVAPAF